MENKDEIIIQEQIESAMKEQFERLLEDNKNDLLLKLLIDKKLESVSIDDLKEILLGDVI